MIFPSGWIARPVAELNERADDVTSPVLPKPAATSPCCVGNEDAWLTQNICRPLTFTSARRAFVLLGARTKLAVPLPVPASVLVTHGAVS